MDELREYQGIWKQPHGRREDIARTGRTARGNYLYSWIIADLNSMDNFEFVQDHIGKSLRQGQVFCLFQLPTHTTVTTHAAA
jgi:hypothetical protein